MITALQQEPTQGVVVSRLAAWKGTVEVAAVVSGYFERSSVGDWPEEGCVRWFCFVNC